MFSDKRTTLDIVLLSVALVASLLVVVVATVGVVFWRLKSHSVSQPPEVVGGEQTTDDTVAVEVTIFASNWQSGIILWSRANALVLIRTDDVT